jgi:type IV secretory pathway TrbF-like protein
MTTTTNPTDALTGAKRHYLELFGTALTWNTYLKIAVALLLLLSLALVALCFWTVQRYGHLRPLVIRIDDVGRATAIQYDALTYAPREPELKYFLTQFVTLHYSRRRASVKETYPRSLLFLDSPLADALITHDTRTRTLEKFLADGSDEVDIEINNVTLSELRTPPFKAAVDATKVYYATGSFEERRRESFIVQIDFKLRDTVSTKQIPVNPLGLTITYVREDQAFR